MIMNSALRIEPPRHRAHGENHSLENSCSTRSPFKCERVLSIHPWCLGGSTAPFRM